MADTARTKLSESLDGLHSESMAAIQERRPQVVEHVGQLYEDILRSIAERWMEYGEPFEHDLMSGGRLLGGGIVSGVGQHLFEETVEACKANNREAAFTCTAVPIRVAYRGGELGATGLVRTMLSLAAPIYRACATLPSNDVTNLVRGRLGNLLIEYGQLYMGSILEDVTRVDQDRLNAAKATRVCFEAINSLLKEMLEANDIENLIQLDQRWDEILEFWSPGTTSTEDIAATAGPESQDGSAFQEIQQELNRAKTRFRFGLALWSLKLLQESGRSKEGIASAILHFSSYFETANHALSAAEASSWNGDGRPAWSDWVLYEHSNRAGVVDTTTPLLTAFLVLATLRADRQVELHPSEWLHSSAQRIQEVSARLSANAELWSLLGIPSFQERLSQLSPAIESSISRWQRLREEGEAESEVDPEKISKFLDEINRSWITFRLIPSIFKRFGAHAVNEGEPPLTARVVRKVSLPKRLFYRDAADLDYYARDFAHNLANVEAHLLIRSLVDLPPSSTSGPLKERIEASRRTLLEEGMNPNLLLVPISWRLRRLLTGSTWREREDEKPAWLPAEVRSWHVGEVQNLHIIEHPQVPNDRVFILDISSFGKWKDWSDQDGHLLSMSAKTFDQEQAMSFLRQQEGEHGSDIENEEDKILAIRKDVHFEISARFELEVIDPNAATWFAIEPDLQMD